MVLNQVNLTIKAGEIYGLVGENGAGKSSLMKVITGLTKPTSGEISLFGKKNLEDERNKIGCLIENPALYMDMTARQKFGNPAYSTRNSGKVVLMKFWK